MVADCAGRYVAGRAARGALAHNQAFWGMLAEVASFHVLGDGAALAAVVAETETALGEVDVEGYLPLELRRNEYALSYHNFAMEPLTQIAVIARAHGLDLVGAPGAPLRRLAERTLAGLADPKMFEARTGYPQVTDRLETRAHSAWIPLYRALSGGGA
jgi:poly(beta-D-mannuronate) lyase